MYMKFAIIAQHVLQPADVETHICKVTWQGSVYCLSEDYTYCYYVNLCGPALLHVHMFTYTMIVHSSGLYTSCLLTMLTTLY